MTKNVKLWQLYIVPFLVILAMMVAELAKTEYAKHLPFDQIAKETNALAEIDYRSMQRATVSRVIDGDTVELETGEKVRYIGVDTPETKHPNKPVQCFGREAAQKNKELVEGKEILLEKDVSETDRYGRLLRYIYLPNPEATDEAIFVNELLIEQGFAQVITYPPDVKYHPLLLQAQQQAQSEEKGLWGSCN
ncbi:thermonuclease family protein [Candidatus Roizmanbacteria bacterium]|nr:MAG: thermonuclease family protein [Candidatus Roizmanbacteria bacterium]